MPFITQGKTNLQFVSIVIILGVLVGGGILGYYYWWIAGLEARLGELEVRLPEAQPLEVKIPADETADWKTYRNEEYGFGVRYPPSWSFDAKKALSVNLPDQSRNFIQVNISNGVKGRQDESMSRCQPRIAAIVYQIGKLRDNQKNFEEFVNFQIENPERGPPPVVKPKLIPATIGGHNALKIEEVVDNCEAEFYYVDQDADNYTTISFIVEENNDKLVIDQILSTFKFLK